MEVNEINQSIISKSILLNWREKKTLNKSNHLHGSARRICALPLSLQISHLGFTHPRIQAL